MFFKKPGICYGLHNRALFLHMDGNRQIFMSKIQQMIPDKIYPLFIRSTRDDLIEGRMLYD
jgi:hypothetical protein